MLNNILKPYQKSLSNNLRAAFNEDYEKAGLFFLRLLIIHWIVAATIMAFSYNTWLLGILGGMVITGSYYVIYRLDKGGFWTRMAAGCAIMAFSAVFIQQHMGRLEMHFHVFIGMAFLLRFKDPLPVLSAAITIAIHHVTINYCQSVNMSVFGSPLMVFNYGAGFDIVFLHSAFVLAEAIVLWLIIDDDILQFTELNKNLRQTKDILETVQEGLLLLDDDLVIGNQYSRSLESIFNTTGLAGKRLDAVLQPLVTEKTLETTRDYVNILFKQKVNEKLIRELNPLDRVEINIGQKDGEYNVKYIECSFSRVTRDKDVKQVLMTISDISEQVRLETALKQSNANSKEQFNVLTSILHVEPKTLYDFIVNAKEKLMSINRHLKESTRNTSAHESKLLKIARLAHALKGEASMLELEYIVERLHQFEDVISSIQKKTNITGDSFLPLTVKLDLLIKDIELIFDLCDKLQSLSRTTLPESNLPGIETPAQAIWKRLQLMTEKIAEEQGKKVTLVETGFTNLPVTQKHQRSFNDILVQCIRNAIVHGIEPPELRKNSNKLSFGCIHINAEKEGNQICIRIRDDGKGINLSRIKEKAVSLNLWTEKEIDAFSHQQLINVIFHPGFSTAQRVNHNAGRGIGMELIRRECKSLGAKLGLSTKTGIYTEIKISLPSNAESNSDDYSFEKGVA